MHSENRKTIAGFTLLESLIALAVTASFLILTLGVFARSATLPERAKRTYFREEFARSLLDEAFVRYPNFERNGVFAGQWEWSFEEEPVPGVIAKHEAVSLGLVRLHVRVVDQNAGNGLTALSVLIAFRKTQ